MAGAAATLLDPLGWPWELPAHFRVQFLTLLGAVALGALAARRRVMAASSFSFALFLWGLSGAPARPAPCHEPARGGEVFRLCSFNVYTANRDFDATLRFLRTNAFDVVFLMEVDRRWLAALEALRPEYPFLAAEPREDNFGVALLARRAPLRHEVLELGPAGVPSIDADFGAVRLVGTHPLPPGGRDMAELRDAQLRAVAAHVRGGTRVLLAGDLNCTPWTAPFRALAKAGGLRDTSPGFGWQPTWPSPFPGLLRIPIDHALVTTDLTCVARSVGPDLGSDHRPLLVAVTARGP